MSRHVFSVVHLLLLLRCVSSKLCPSRCECNDAEFHVVCQNANLDMIPWTLHPRLQHLNLRNNQIKEVSASFSVYTALKYLDLSQNQLVDLGSRSFKAQVALEVLDLSKNMISGLTNITLDGLSRLEQLYLAFNYVDNVPVGTFSEMTALQKLDISHNRIGSLQPDVFRGAKKLRMISLRNNKLTSIPTNAFRQLPELAVLDLGLNEIREVPAEAFLPLRTLEELRLDGCRLKTVQPGAFRALGGLRILSVEDNELTDTPSGSFSDIPRLEEIHIGQNPMNRLKDRAFQHLRHLRTIALSGATELRHVEPNAFIDNQDLESLTLSHNTRLNQIDPVTFRPLSRLRRVNLRANNLGTLSVDLLSWDELEFLDVRDNPFVCNCSLLWLFRTLHHTLSSNGTHSSPFANETTRVKCKAPSSIAGLYLHELQEDFLDCSGNRLMRYVLITAGVTLVLLLVLVSSICLKYRERISSSCKKKLGGKTASKEPEFEKAYVFEDEAYICQLSAARQPLRFLPNSDL